MMFPELIQDKLSTKEFLKKITASLGYQLQSLEGDSFTKKQTKTCHGDIRFLLSHNELMQI